VWKGNIRQLHKVLQNLVDMSTLNGEEVNAENLPVFRSMVEGKPDLSASPSLGFRGLPSDVLCSLADHLVSDSPLQTALDVFEKFKIQAMLARHMKLGDAADALGISRSSLDMKRKKYGL
jgi:transcriptional regulator with PAS, ATPase and Fis domain